MTLRGINEDGDLVGLDDDEEILRKVMTVMILEHALGVAHAAGVREELPKTRSILGAEMTPDATYTH